MALNPLTNKQQKFVAEYLKTLNATQAALKAGYSKNTAKDIGCQNLAKLNVQAEIQKARAKQLERANIDAEHVLRRLYEIDQLDILDILNEDMSMKPITQWPKSWRTSISGLDVQEIMAGTDEDGKVNSAVIKKIKWPDKLKNIELLGKHTLVGAFNKDTQESSDDVATLLAQVLAKQAD